MLYDTKKYILYYWMVQGRLDYYDDYDVIIWVRNSISLVIEVLQLQYISLCLMSIYLFIYLYLFTYLYQYISLYTLYLYIIVVRSRFVVIYCKIDYSKSKCSRVKII